MKTTQDAVINTLFGDVFGLIADALGQSREFVPAGRAASDSRHGHDGSAVPEPKPADGLLARAGQWILRRQTQGVAPELARSQDVFQRLDRWLWAQHQREAEAYLAQAQDVFDLERRIEHLERRSGPVFG